MSGSKGRSIVDFALHRAGVPIAEAPFVIHHAGSMDETRAAEKDAHYLAIGRREVDGGTLHPNLLTIVARSAWKAGRTDEALAVHPGDPDFEEILRRTV